jgi:hypothetical protein
VDVLRTQWCHLCTGFQQCKSLVECALRDAVLYGTQHNVPWEQCPGCWCGGKTASPEQADFGGLSSGAALNCRRPTRKRVFPDQIFRAYCDGL